ncbi:MAG: 30S ribosomal protein S3 [Bifidobacteriaceae bacterium]|jgi:small subunit ribosomal protein S3|nr:30S ribosomal protein S3 [Bifidobacteriaceae bacterium]
MGQKVNPRGYRLGITTEHRVKWFADENKKGVNYATFVKEDNEIRKYIKKNYANAVISKVVIEKDAKTVTVSIYAARIANIIGAKGATAEKIKEKVAKITNKEVKINCVSVATPELDAQVVAQGVAEQLEARVTFRRAMKKAIDSSLRGGAKGIKIQCSGRLGGAEMSRAEFYREGQVPLHTLRANVDYGFYEAYTTYGLIGVKVWIYRGDMTDAEYMMGEFIKNKDKDSLRRNSRPKANFDAKPGDNKAPAEATEAAAVPAEKVEKSSTEDSK